MAKPMPRRRALRLLGGAVVSTALPSSLWPSAARGGPATRRRAGCEGAPDCKEHPGTKTCLSFGIEGNDGCTRYIRVCCPQGPEEQSECCPAKHSSTCCYKGQDCQLYQSGDRQYGRCVGCPSGHEKCGTTCCGIGEKCADPGHDQCCPPRTIPCGSGLNVNCCATKEVCCKNTCCRPRTRCTTAKGKTVCTPCTHQGEEVREHVLHEGAELLQREVLPEEPEVLLRGPLLPQDGHMLRRDLLPQGQEVLRRPLLRRQGGVLRQGLLPEGQAVRRRRAIRYDHVVPPRALIRVGGQAVCCQPTDTVKNGQCCPKNSNSCDPCDPPCRPGYYCREGGCLRIPSR